MKNGKFGKENIIYFAEFPIYNKMKRTNNSGILIITGRFLLFCKDNLSLLYKAKLSNIDRVEVYEGGEDEKLKQKIYHIYAFTTNNRNYVFETVRYPLAEMTYNMIMREISNY